MARLIMMRVLILFAFNGVAYAGEGQGSSTEYPLTSRRPSVQRLLFITAPSRGASLKAEHRLMDQIKLAMDAVDIEVITPSVQNFDSMTVTKQVEVIRPMLAQYDAVAAVWLTRTRKGLQLSIVTASAGRALVQVVDAPPGPGAESDLAVAVKEILEATSLDESQTVTQGRVTGQEGDGLINPGGAGIMPWKVQSSFLVSGGLTGGIGPSLEVGGVAGIESPVAGSLFSRLYLGGVYGPWSTDTSARIRSWSVISGLGFLFSWNYGCFGLAPGVGVSLEYQDISMKVGQGPDTRHSAWRAYLDADLGVRWFPSDFFGFFIDASMFVTPVRDIYRRASDKSIIFATPFIRWSCSLGIMFTTSPEQKENAR